MTALSCASAPPPPPPPASPTTPAPIARLPEEPVPLGRLPGDARPTRESLALTIDPEGARFGGTATIELTIEKPRDVLWLHGRGLKVLQCDLSLPGGEHVGATWSEADPSGVARVSLDRPVTGPATLTLRYDAPYDPTLVGVYRTAVGGGHAVFSKFEAIYARRAFPCFDEPSFKVPFDVTLTVPHGVVALGNMPVAKTTAVGSLDTITFATTPPLPTYLVAFAVGPFESRSTTLPAAEGRPAPLPLAAVALRGREANTAFAVAETPALLAAEERYYGVPFPFPKLDLVAVPDFQSGAMENAGLITFADSALLVDAKEATLSQRIGVLGVVAHEAAHQWFGDLVTMSWWDDLWLNESFATFLSRKALRTVKPELSPELVAVRSADRVMNLDGLGSARRIRQPITSNDDITNAFDGITYAKGEAVLTMVERFVGEDAFQRGLHAYLVAHAGGNATTGDLVAALSQAAKRDLAPLFSSFLDQPGAPLVTAHATCEGGHGAIALEQSRWLPYGSTAPGDTTWTVPVCARAGVKGKVVEACTLLDARARAGSIALPGCADWFMPNADARGYYRFALAPGDLARLRDHGTKLLATTERLSLAEDLDAAFHSASIPSGDALRALEPLARDVHGAVASAPLATYGFVHDELLDGPAQAKLGRYVSALYAPAVRSLGWRSAPKESTWRSLERGELLGFLARRTEDPAVLKEAARLGRAYLGLGGDGMLHPSLVDADLAPLAIAAAVRLGGAPAFEAVVAALTKSNDAPKRRSFLLALASTHEPSLVGRALDLSLDPALRKNERLATLGALLQAPATRGQAWGWVVAHFDQLVPMLPDRYAGALPTAVRFCDAAKAEEVRAFFAPRVPSLTGGTRNLAQAVEAITSCAKLAGAQRDSARAFVKGL
jgi:alanyl aminopeptidase